MSNYTEVKSTDEIKDISEISFESAKGSDFWMKPLSDIGFQQFLDCPLGLVVSGTGEFNKDEKVLVSSPLGAGSSILYSSSTPDRVFLFKVVSIRRDDDVSGAVSSTPIACIEIPKGIKITKSVMEVFSYNFVLTIGGGISMGDASAKAVIDNWATEEIAKKFVNSVSSSGGGAKSKLIEKLAPLIEKLAPLIEDEASWKKMFPNSPTFSEWKEAVRLRKEAGKLGVDIDINSDIAQG